jgi:hypothetical protein
VTLFEDDPFEWAPPFSTQEQLYAELDDPRAVPVLLAQWNKAIEKKREATDHWVTWRLRVVGLFARHGGAGELAFLQAQVKTTKPKRLAKAMEQAIAEIAKR